MTTSVLSLSKYGVAFGKSIVLRTVDLEIPQCGIFALLGPSGTGKSTLLRTICGVNNAFCNLSVWGEATYIGEELGKSEFPMLVSQSMQLITANVQDNILNELPESDALTRSERKDLAIRLLVQSGLTELTEHLEKPVVELSIPTQRYLAIARVAVSKPRLLCVDEPTADLDEAGAERILRYLSRLGEEHAVLVVLHNQKQAKNFADITALLAGGWIQECNYTGDFFASPQNDVTRSFLRTGSCHVPSPNAKKEDLDSSATIPTPPPLPQVAREYMNDSFGPRGFSWLMKGQLAGTPMPGIVADVEYDLRALQRVGVKVLVSLTEQPFSADKLGEYDIESMWLKIIDMKAPKFEEAYAMCRRVQDRIASGQPVAYHCKAGLGRTGTMLAAQLVMEGKSALDALESVRKIEPRWVQSEEQVKFIEGFADYVIRQGTATAGDVA
ncbi:MAG: ATP-binding cassette domain-containing protein [Pseudomonadota bacterium]|nr:ATP-binding cassette domain-containing protein [Pseudomonadota bacterium]